MTILKSVKSLENFQEFPQDRDQEEDLGSKTIKTFKIGERGVSRPRPGLEDHITVRFVGPLVVRSVNRHNQSADY